MVALNITGYLSNFLETKIVLIALLEREYNVKEIFAELGNINYPFARIGHTNHRFGSMQGNRADFLKLVDKMIVNSDND